MSELQEKGNSVFGIEDVVIGDRSSLPSKVVFFLLCLVPFFSTLLFGGVDNVTWIFISIAWALIVLFWIAETWKAGGLLLDTNSIQLPLAGFILIGLIQLLPLGGSVAGLAVPASNALSLDPYSTRFFLIKLFVYLVYFGACLTFINNEKRLQKAVYFVIVFGSVMSLYGILQRLASPDGIYGLRETSGARPFGPFVNQHHFATFMQMTGGLTLAMLFGKKTRREVKMLLAAAVVVMGVATVSTGSRGGLLGFLATLIFVSLLNFLSGRWSGESRSKAGMQRNFVIAAAGIALIVVIFGVVLLIGGNDALLRSTGAALVDSDVTTGRLHFWPIALKIFLAHPILGAGFESFGVAFTQYDTLSGTFRVEQAHNEYLQTLADAGIAGFVCLLTFIGLLFRKGLKTIATSTGFRNEAAIGALAGCLGVLVHSFFDFPLRTPSNAFFFLMLCAIATVSIASEEKPSRRRRSTAP
ncbi:MAG: O-antigen ligase family protein [Pyrinomonadaceae bacterium]